MSPKKVSPGSVRVLRDQAYRWSAVARHLFTRITKSDMTAYAAALAYNLLFALFPLGLFLTALLGFLHLPPLSQSLGRLALPVLPPTVVRFMGDVLEQAQRHKNPAVLSLGIVGFLWGMSGAFRQMIDAVNHAYRYPTLRRRPWQTYLLSIGLGLFVGTLMIVALIVSISGTHLVAWLLIRLTGVRLPALATAAIRWSSLFVIIWSILAVVFAVTPDRPRPFRWFTPGSLLALVVWLLVSWGFSFYTAHFHTYNQMYGSLGIVILLMLYLYLVSLSLLLGVELNATLEDGTPPSCTPL